MRSMTGCGVGLVQRNSWEVTAELKTVNHRFLDLSMRLPRNIAFLEPTVREETAKGLKRGHVDVFLTVRNTEASPVQIKVDEELACQYRDAGTAIAEACGAENDLSVSRLLAMEGVVTLAEKEMDRETVTALCSEAMAMAVAQVTVMREREGAHLREDLRIHLENASALREKILTRAPRVVTEYREKLENRASDGNVSGSGRGDRQKNGFSDSGDESGSEHNRFKSAGQRNRTMGCRSEKRN